MIDQINLAELACPDTVLHSATQHITVSALIAARRNGLEHLSMLAGRYVVIHGDGFHLAKWLLMLDGIAARLLLVPLDACDGLRERVLTQGEVEVIICNQMITHDAWPEEIVFRDTNTLPVFDYLERFHFTSAANRSSKTAWVIPTSGTTSTPKLVAHSAQSLIQSCARGERYQKMQWGLIYDPSRFAGLQVVLQALIGGGVLLIPDAQAEFRKRITWLAGQNCTALSATPSLWRKLLMTEKGPHLRLQQITLGGEIADPVILRALKTAFPESHITHIYASTEAGVGFAVHDGQAGFPSSFLQFSERVPPMRIDDSGTLWLMPKVREQHYLNADQCLFSDDGWIDSGDMVELIEERVFFRGRLNGSINIGGNKVIPEEVEAVILQLPEIASVVVRGKASSVAGSLVEALVVPAVSSFTPVELAAIVKSHCRALLPTYKVPAFVHVVSELQTSASGKIERTT